MFIRILHDNNINAYTNFKNCTTINLQFCNNQNPRYNFKWLDNKLIFVNPHFPNLQDAVSKGHWKLTMASETQRK